MSPATGVSAEHVPSLLWSSPGAPAVTRPSTKQRIRDAVEKLPPEATVEDAMERLYVLAKIERGLAQADGNETVSHDEVRGRLGL